MTYEPRAETHTSVSPDEAYSVLGNETRIEILQTLGEADDPLYFTELRERVGLGQGGQFNYHLDKVVGHFVEKTDDGYALAPPGERVVEAILSGAVTDDPNKEPAVLDQKCYHCDAPVVMTYRGHLSLFCTSCSGNYEISASEVVEQADLDSDSGEIGFLRGFELPPAGIQDRSGLELLRAGNAWANLERIASRIGVCPRCSAKIDASIRVCDTHDIDGGACDECGNRYAVTHVHDCTNCNYDRMTQFGWLLLAETDLLNFFADHGINPIAPESPMSTRAVLDRYDEEVISTDPFRGRFTFAIDDESITLTIDDDLAVVDVARHGPSIPGRQK